MLRRSLLLLTVERTIQESQKNVEEHQLINTHVVLYTSTKHGQTKKGNGAWTRVTTQPSGDTA